jgi:hypothetical protein
MKVRLFAAIALVMGCATAAEEIDEGVGPGRKRDSGTPSVEEDTDTTEEDSSTPGTDSGSSSTDTGSSGTDTGSSSTEDTGSSSTDTGSMSTDTGPAGTCKTLTYTDCAAATSLGSLSGDTGSGVKTATGNNSQYLQVTVSEDDSSVFSSKDPRVRITLTSTGGNFDLYTYLGASKGDGGGIECSTIKASSTNPATSDDLVALSWNDNRPIGGHDDTRVVSIEVRATMPSCEGASWSLKVEGNK